MAGGRAALHASWPPRGCCCCAPPAHPRPPPPPCFSGGQRPAACGAAERDAARRRRGTGHAFEEGAPNRGRHHPALPAHSGAAKKPLQGWTGAGAQGARAGHEASACAVYVKCLVMTMSCVGGHRRAGVGPRRGGGHASWAFACSIDRAPSIVPLMRAPSPRVPPRIHRCPPLVTAAGLTCTSLCWPRYRRPSRVYWVSIRAPPLVQVPDTACCNWCGWCHHHCCSNRTCYRCGCQCSCCCCCCASRAASLRAAPLPPCCCAGNTYVPPKAGSLSAGGGQAGAGGGQGGTAFVPQTAALTFTPQ